MERAEKEGYGKYHDDVRDYAGGGTLGAVVSYFGGPVGGALAGPIVEAAHPYGERLSRNMINAGDKIGGAGGAMMLDPVGTMSSGKYKWKDIAKGAVMGPLMKLFD